MHRGWHKRQAGRLAANSANARDIKITELRVHAQHTHRNGAPGYALVSENGPRSTKSTSFCKIPLELASRSNLKTSAMRFNAKQLPIRSLIQSVVNQCFGRVDNRTTGTIHRDMPGYLLKCR